MTQTTDLDIQKAKLEEELKNLKANQPLLVELIKEVIRENLSISVNTDASFERDRKYISVSVSLEIGDEYVSHSESSVSA